MPGPENIPEPPPEPGRRLTVRAGPADESANERRARELEARFTAFNADVDAMINASKLGANSGRYKSWRNFAGRYAHYLDTVTDWNSPVIGPTLDQFQTDFRAWFSWYRRAFGINPSAKEPRINLDGARPVQMAPGVWALLAVFGMYALGKMAGK